MMLLEREIENSVITRLEALETGLAIHGAWRVEDGKNEESADIPGTIAVVVNPREYTSEAMPTANIVTEITLAVRAEMDASGEIFHATAERLMDLLQMWQDDIDIACVTFDIFYNSGEKKFDVCGVAIAGGGVTLDKVQGVWTLALSVTVRGIINRSK